VRPQQRHYAADATTGRGLMLVEALAEDWGVQASPTGKTVWCRISASGDLSPLFDDSWQETDPATRPGAPTIGEGTTRGARAIAA
jgi:hypothetical protein